MREQMRKTRAHALAFAAACALAVFTMGAEAPVMAQGHTGHTSQATGQAHSGDMSPGLHFVDMMMMHHQQGIEMARLAEEKSPNADVKSFSRKTIDAQGKDLKQLQFLRDTHYSGRPAMSHEQMMAHMQGMPGHGGMKMDMEGDMNKLRAAQGREFDRLFLDTMTHHHQMAVQMSKDAVTSAEHSGIKEFARRSAAAQQAEIAEMNRLKAGVGGKVVRKPAARTKKPAPKKAKHSGHTGH